MMRATLPPLGMIGIAALVICGMAAAPAGSPPPYLHAPSVTTYARHVPNGVTILPEGRYLKPVGRHMPMARWPHGLALSPDGSTLFVASRGVGQFITQWGSAHPAVVSWALGEGQGNSGGAAFSPDGKTLYWSSGDSGSVYCVDVPTHAITAEIPLNVAVGGQTFADSDAMDVKSSADGAYLYCADVTNFRVAVIDIRQKRVIGSVRMGRYPYALAVAGRRV